jgi:hypothetical protein
VVSLSFSFVAQLEIESRIFASIYDLAFETSCAPEEDAEILARCRRFANASQSDLLIPESLQTPESVPFLESVAKLRRLGTYKTPTLKLACVLEAAQAVYATLGRHSPDSVVGGDEFMDIWIFVTLKSQVSRLWSEVCFVREFAGHDTLQGEMGYYFSTLEFAAMYLRGSCFFIFFFIFFFGASAELRVSCRVCLPDLSEDKIRIPDEQDDLLRTPILVCDKCTRLPLLILSSPQRPPA